MYNKSYSSDKSLSRHNNAEFSTYENDNTGHGCAKYTGSGGNWWHVSGKFCVAYQNINEVYGKAGDKGNSSRVGIFQWGKKRSVKKACGWWLSSLNFDSKLNIKKNKNYTFWILK